MNLKLNPFSLFTLNHKKTQPKNLPFFVFVQSSFCFTVSSNIFPFFFHHFFSSITFSFHLFVHLFLIFSPFSFLSFLHSFFISPSQCFSFFFLYLMCFLNCFSPSPFLCIFFCFTSFFPSLLLFLISFFFSYFFFTFFFIISVSFFARKNSKISVVNFAWWNYVFVFWTLPSSVFHLLFFPPCVVLIPCLFHVSLIISVSWHYFSWFSFINLLFGSQKKKLSFCFWTKVSKISLILFLSLFLKKKTLFLSFIIFAFEFVFWCMIFKNMFCYFSLFSHSFLKNIWVLLS